MASKQDYPAFFSGWASMLNYGGGSNVSFSDLRGGQRRGYEAIRIAWSKVGSALRESMNSFAEVR